MHFFTSRRMKYSLPCTLDASEITFSATTSYDSLFAHQSIIHTETKSLLMGCLLATEKKDNMRIHTEMELVPVFDDRY